MDGVDGGSEVVGRGDLRGWTVRHYDLPGSLAEYLPDPDEPVDRWMQGPFSANALTTERVICDLAGGVPEAILDPLCGYGSAALAARRVGVPFVGAERVALRAAVTAAKTLATTDDLDEASFLARTLMSGGSAVADGHSLAVRSLAATIAVLSERVDFAEAERIVAIDLQSAAAPSELTSIRRGDARRQDIWDSLPALGTAFAFISPPFGAEPADAIWAPSTRQLAALAFPETFASGAPAESTEVLVFQVASVLAATGLVVAGVVEVEDETRDLSVCAAIGTALERTGHFQVAEVLVTKPFTALGTLCMLSFTSIHSSRKR